MSFDIYITKYRKLWNTRRCQVTMIYQLYNFMPPSILKRLKFLLCSLLKSSLWYWQEYSFTGTHSFIHSRDTQGSVYCVPAQPRPAQRDKAGPPWWNVTVRFCPDPEASVGAIPRHKPSPNFVSVAYHVESKIEHFMCCVFIPGTEIHLNFGPATSQSVSVKDYCKYSL